MDDVTRHIVDSILNSDDDDSVFDGFSDVGSDIEVPDLSDSSDSDSDPEEEVNDRWTSDFTNLAVSVHVLYKLFLALLGQYIPYRQRFSNLFAEYIDLTQYAFTGVQTGVLIGHGSIVLNDSLLDRTDASHI